MHPCHRRIGETVSVPFGQPSGPPASANQIQELLTLLKGAGHTDFRDARGPMRFTQRQGGGQFTHDEAAAFIERLQDAQSDKSNQVTHSPRRSAQMQFLRRLPPEQLAVELRRRGWTVTKPYALALSPASSTPSLSHSRPRSRICPRTPQGTAASVRDSDPSNEAGVTSSPRRAKGFESRIHSATGVSNTSESPDQGEDVS